MWWRKNANNHAVFRDSNNVARTPLNFVYNRPAFFVHTTGRIEVHEIEVYLFDSNRVRRSSTVTDVSTAHSAVHDTAARWCLHSATPPMTNPWSSHMHCVICVHTYRLTHHCWRTILQPYADHSKCTRSNSRPTKHYDNPRHNRPTASKLRISNVYGPPLKPHTEQHPAPNREFDTSRDLAILSDVQPL